MEIRNNNQAIEKELSGIYYKKNRQRNRILIMAIVMSIFLLYAAFSIADGKLRSDYLIDVRGMGTLATVSLENGSVRQYEQMKNLSYIADVGIKKNVISGKYRDLWSGNLVYVDDTAFEKMLKPAYTDVIGSYPTKENEIMMPIRCFQQMGIDSPELGIQISVELELPDGGTEPCSFLVSGYYTDYVDSAVSMPEIFVSRAFMDQRNIPLFPVDKIMATQSSLEEGENVETRLYSDVIMEYDSQQIFSENPMVMQSVEGVFGSVSIAVACGIIVVLCAFMLIYNVVAISMGRDIQQYGLLKVLGTTNMQLRKIVFRQSIRNIVIGSIIGGVIGIIVVKIFLNSILQRLFMQGLGKNDVNGIYLQYLVITILLISITAFFASSLALRQIMRWNALDSVRYVETDVSYRRKRIESTDNMTIYKLAWRNVTRSKKKILISVLTLLLVGITAMGAVVIMRGTDLTNKMEENPDFQMGILAGIFRHPEKVPLQINDSTQILSPEAVDTIRNLKGIEQQTLELTTGSYAVIDFEQDEALYPRRESFEGDVSGLAFATLQIVDEDYVLELEEYIKKNEMNVDISSMKNGTGCILLHHNEMSRILNERVEAIIGMPVHFYSLDSYGDKDNIDSYEKGSLSCAGYLDMSDKYFPKLQMTSIGNNVNYFIMTAEAFEKLGFSEKIFDISFDSQDDYKIAINQKLSQIIQQENVKSGEMDTFYLSANYLLLQTEENKITTANTILGVLVVIIFVIGIMNFANTLITDHTMRKKELAILESIGLTRIQLWQMIFTEGIYYWIIIFSGMLSLGSLGIWLLGMAISQKLLYFKFIYPWKMLLLFAAILFLVNLVLAQIMYCKDRKQTLKERIGN